MCPSTLLIYKGRTYVSALRLGAHAGAPLQTVSFSYFYERNLDQGAE